MSLPGRADRLPPARAVLHPPGGRERRDGRPGRPAWRGLADPVAEASGLQL